MCGTQDALYICQLDHGNLICGESGGFRRGKHSAALFRNPNQDVRMAVHGDDFVCLADDGLRHIDNLLNSKYKAKDVVTLGVEDSDVEGLVLLNSVFRVGNDQIGYYLDVARPLFLVVLCHRHFAHFLYMRVCVPLKYHDHWSLVQKHSHPHMFHPPSFVVPS